MRYLSRYLLITLIVTSVLITLTQPLITHSWRGQWVEVLKDELVGPSGSPREFSRGDHAYLMLELMIKPPKEVKGELYSTVTPTECFLPTVKSLKVRVAGPVISDWLGIAGSFRFGDVVKVYLPVKVVEGAGTYVAKLYYRIEYLSCANIVIDNVIYNRTYVLPIKVVITGKPKVVTEFRLMSNLSKSSWALAKVVVRNLGDAVAKDVTTELSLSNALVNESVIHLGNLSPGKVITKYLRIRATGDYVVVNVRTTYLGPYGTEHEYVTTHSYVLKKLSNYLVATVTEEPPKEVEVRSLVKVGLSIECLGRGEGVSNVEVKASSPNALVNPEVVSIGWLGRGSSKYLSIYLIPKSRGEVPTYVVINYLGSDGRRYSIVKLLKFNALNPPKLVLSTDQPYVTKESKYLIIKVSNLGDLPAQDTELIIDSLSGAVPKERVFSIGELLPSKSVVIKVPVTNVSSDVSACFTIKYLDVGSSSLESLSKCIKYPLMRFLRRAEVTVSVPRELSIVVGNCLSKSLVVRVKGLAKDIKLGIEAPAGIEASVEPSELINKSVGSYLGNLTVCVPKSLSPGNYLLVITCRYLSGSEWREYLVSTLVRVRGIEEPVITAELVNSTLGVGTSEVVIKLRSSKLLKELFVKATSPIGSASATYYGVNEATLPVKVTVLPSEVGSSVSFEVLIKYVDTDGVKGSVTYSLPLVITGEPDLQLIYATVAPKVASLNSTVAVSALIANRGVAPAYSAVASIYPPKGFEVIGGSSMYLGEIGRGSTSVISFSMRVVNASGGTYEVPINVTYYDSLHKLHYRVFKVVIKVGGSNLSNYTYVSSSTQGSSLLPPPPKVPNYLIVAVVAASVVVAAVVTALAIRGSRR